MDLLGESSLPYALSICLILLVLFFMAEGTDTPNQKRCTQTVKEERVRYVSKRISVTRKIPAKCSGWDRDWSWLSNKDCSDKYRVEYMIDKRQVKFTTYRTEHVCCPDENGSWCDVSVADSNRAGEPGYTTETHTLLTVLLPVIATLAFIFIISTIIICLVIIRKKRRERNCTTAGKHSYEFVKGKDSKKKVGNKSSADSGKDKLGYKVVGGGDKGVEACYFTDIPYSVEVVDGGPDRLTVSNETSELPMPCDISKTPIPNSENIETTPLEKFKDLDKDTVIDNALLYDILIEGRNRSDTEPTAPPMDHATT